MAKHDHEKLVEEVMEVCDEKTKDMDCFAAVVFWQEMADRVEIQLDAVHGTIDHISD